VVNHRKVVAKLNATVKKMVEEKLKESCSKLQEKVTLTADMREISVFSQGPRVLQSYFRVPVTAAIPTQRLAGVGPDDRYRLTKHLRLSGVALRFVLHFSRSVDVFAMCYPAKVQRSATAVAVQGDPVHTFALGTGAATARRLLTGPETNMLNSHGPFAVRPGPNAGIVLDAIDDTLFTCQLARHEGRPIGKVSWKNGIGKEEVKKGMIYKDTYLRTQNWNDNPNAARGYVQSDSVVVQVYFDLGKDLKFVTEVGSEPVFEHPLEILFGVRVCGTNGNTGVAEDVTAASIEGFTIDLY